MKKGILFDLDGTLWDSAETVAKSWNEVIREEGGAGTLSADDMRALMGKPMDEIADIIFEGMKGDRNRLLDRCAENEHAYVRRLGGRLYDGVEEQLEAMKKAGCELFIVSNCQCGYIEAFLDHYTGLKKYFTDTECWGRTGLQKNENITLVIERNALDRAVYVGDTQRDCDSAEGAVINGAPVPFIHAAYGFGSIDHEVPRAESFYDLLPLANKLTEE